MKRCWSLVFLWSAAAFAFQGTAPLSVSYQKSINLPVAGGIELRELRRDRAGDHAPVVGIRPVVGVAVGVHVAHGPRDLGRGSLEDVASDRRVQIARVTRVDLVVAALIDERRKVADLQLEPGGDQEVRAGEFQDEGGLGVHEVGVLIPLGQGERLDPIPAD